MRLGERVAVVDLDADIARAALFLASDDAARVTGSTFIVDGGRCA